MTTEVSSIEESRTLYPDAVVSISRNQTIVDLSTLPVVENDLTAPVATAPKVIVGTQDPTGTVTGNAGDQYWRVDGANSTVYINQTPVGPGTVWTSLA